jgi:hypothetical protein
VFPIKTNREIMLNREIESEAADLAGVCSSLATGDDAARFVRPRGWSIAGEKGPRLMKVPRARCLTRRAIMRRLESAWRHTAPIGSESARALEASHSKRQPWAHKQPRAIQNRCAATATRLIFRLGATLPMRQKAFLNRDT